MQKIFTVFASGAAVVFGIAILLMSFLAATNPMRVLPFDDPTTGLGQVLSTSSATAANDYYLPYPGILPDSLLYRIKAARDIVSLWLTFDPVKKAQKELLFADKRLNAAIVLVDGGKGSLGVSTATKGEKYLENSINQALSLQQRGLDVKSLLLTLEKATGKHAAVLQDLIAKTSGGGKTTLEGTQRTTLMWQKKVKQALTESK